MQDKLITCPRCESPYCYQKISDTYVENNCMYCGYTTSTYMIDGTEPYKTLMAKLPKFYEQVKFIDEEGFVWVPRYYEVIGSGRLFAALTETGDLVWVYEPFVQVEGQWEVDVERIQYFKYDEYPLALIALGVF